MFMIIMGLINGNGGDSWASALCAGTTIRTVARRRAYCQQDPPNLRWPHAQDAVTAHTATGTRLGPGQGRAAARLWPIPAVADALDALDASAAWGACATSPAYRGQCATSPKARRISTGARVPQAPPIGANVPQAPRHKPKPQGTSPSPEPRAPRAQGTRHKPRAGQSVAGPVKPRPVPPIEFLLTTER
jgi:hypothetical protein